MHYYQHHIGDLIKDTSFLKNEEVGIYLKLLWIYYDTEQPLPNSLFELSMKVNARDQQDVLAGILEMFFALENNEWHHTRCDKEIQHYHQQLNTASKAGKASAAKRALNKQSTTVERPLGSCSTDVQLTNNQQPITNNHKPKRESATVVACPPDVAEQVWVDWLSLRKSKKAAVTATVVDGARAEAAKLNWPLEKFLAEWCTRGSQGLKAEWVKPADGKNASFAQQAADVARTTVPGSTGLDPVLVKIEADRKNAVPMPEHIRQQINQVLRKVS
jgi:uncharacterized protein YdaU (DUF1376 family)